MNITQGPSFTQEDKERLFEAIEKRGSLHDRFSEDGKAIATATLAAALVAKMDKPTPKDADRAFTALWSLLWP